MRHHGFVGLDDVDVRAGLAQFAGNHVAGHFCAHQQDALPFHTPAQAAHHGLGYVLLGNDVDGYAALLDGFFCGGADGGDVQVVDPSG